MSRKRAVQRNARRGMRRIEGAAGSPAPRDPLHEGRDPFFSSLLGAPRRRSPTDRKSTRLNSSHLVISYAVFCLKKKKRSTQQHCSQIQTHKQRIHSDLKTPFPPNSPSIIAVYAMIQTEPASGR